MQFFTASKSNFRSRWNSVVEVNWFTEKSARVVIADGRDRSTQDHWATGEATGKCVDSAGNTG